MTNAITAISLAAVATLLPLPVAFAQSSSSPIVTTQHPALFLVGDSIGKTGAGNGERGPWGMGYELIPLFDSARLHVYNAGLGGRSSRGTSRNRVTCPLG